MSRTPHHSPSSPAGPPRPETTALNRRALLAFSAAGVLAGLLAACAAPGRTGARSFAALAAKTAAPETLELAYQGSAGQVTLPELAADLGYLDPVRLRWVGNTISGPQDIQSAATKQTSFGGAFNGAVVKLVAAGAPITSVISYYGVDARVFNGYYTLADSPVRSARDLIGKKVGMNTLGAHLEAVLDIYLSRNGLSVAEIKQVEPLVIPPLNTEQSLRNRQIDVGALSGILQQKAEEKGGLRLLFSDRDLLGDFDAGTYVFRDDFIQAHPNTVRVFVAGVAKAIEWTRHTPLPAILDRLRRIVAGRGRNEDSSALKYFKGYGVSRPGGVITDAEIGAWIDWLERQGQISKGKVKPSQVYTNAFNPYTASATTPTPGASR